MKLLLSAAVFLIAITSSCSFSKPKAEPIPQSAMRYDNVSRSWVPLKAPMVRPATISPNNLPAEKATETAKIIAAPMDSDATESGADEPGFLDRIGRAATSPLRAVGIGDN